MDQAVFETLSQVLADDPNVRMTAELNLRELEKLPEQRAYPRISRYPLAHEALHVPSSLPQSEFPISLTKLTLTKELTIPQRQISFLHARSRFQTSSSITTIA
ncbi:hypothetical protein BC938DRAFT_472867 [Jimgerdemannia flammicorona]|uniref:Uncharacterized protein n=1 Tax=Jimgerdemannia flammicorona TaxID=994334 RepID=A0A433QZV6_9FUNG|nr:hypothetical protein BC938DRAFT_472867 [Jimgerdemannia flammicorona]